MNASPDAPISVFYSYAHVDHELAEKLRKHFKLMERLAIIDIWHDYEILAGRKWNEEIAQQLDASQIVLLLVSSGFINSDYCYDKEMTRALARHEAEDAIVVPILLKPYDNWTAAPFGHLQAVPRNGIAIAKWPNPDEACVNVVEEIRRLVDSMSERDPTHL